MCLKWIDHCHYEGECNTRKWLYLQSVSIPVGQQSWNLNHWLWCYFYWFSWKAGLSEWQKWHSTRVSSFCQYYLGTTHPSSGHYPIVSSEHNHCRNSLWEPGNCFAGCCVKLISKVQLETLMDLLPLLFSQLNLSWEQAADQGPVSCAGSCRMRSQALFLINIHC